jgi:uncharacterized protein YdhG (YjbR/CyaY superfamily)
MEPFHEYLDKITTNQQRDVIIGVLDFIHKEFPFLKRRIAWNYPHFVNEGTFIIALSHAKNHLALAPEKQAVVKFKERAERNGYSVTDQLIRIKWSQTIDYDMIRDIVDFNIVDKQGLNSYWRKE